MKKSEIKILVSLDKDNIPEKISWSATDKEGPKSEETKSISISLWDHIQKETLRIDLWSKDMPVLEMKKFYLDCVGGFSQSILNATGDTYMAKEIKETCDRLNIHLEKELKKQ